MIRCNNCEHYYNKDCEEQNRKIEHAFGRCPEYKRIDVNSASETELNNIAGGIANNFGDRILQRANDEGLSSAAMSVVVGLLLFGIDNLNKENFIDDAKRVLEIAKEEHEKTNKQIEEIISKRNGVHESTE